MAAKALHSVYFTPQSWWMIIIFAISTIKNNIKQYLSLNVTGDIMV